MSLSLIAASLAILVTMLLALARALMGPTLFDRILAVNTFGTKAVLLVSLLAFLSGRPEILDIALLYSLLNFIGVVAALRLVERGSFYAFEDDAARKDEAIPSTANKQE